MRPVTLHCCIQTSSLKYKKKTAIILGVNIDIEKKYRYP